MLKDGFAEGRSDNDADSPGNLGENMTGALGEFRGGGATTHLGANPLAIFDAERGLRTNLLGKEAVSFRGRDASSGGMGLVEIAPVLQVGHDAADGGGAQGLLEALGDGPGRDRLPRFDVGANYVGQNLSVPAFLESRVTHSSAQKSAPTTIVETLSSGVKAHREPEGGASSASF